MGKYDKIDLWGDVYPDLPKRVTLTPFALESGEDFAAVLVLPGGSYSFCSEQEGDPVASWLNSMGISAFVLDYSVAPSRYPQPLNDARRAMQYIRAHAKEFNIDPKRVGVIGFSAGGHLAASLSNLWAEKNTDLNDALEAIDARPDLCILSYPVISWGEFAHLGSRENLLGEKPDADLVYKTSLENAVSAKTPASFLWHTAEDEAVPVENSYLYAMALQKAKVAHELHVYPDGAHGVGLGTIDYRRDAHYAQWRQSCEKWLLKMGF
ncbi:alpha/beta hydrolase [Lentisphaera profundi]|uniref:Alpha/beta hydrolase n=1 Tax=Lentisphaera profundi TaxID=1658616 RepID=A0ABY7VRH3_9BACT|nr:alpha/beta hydrolase [Lentisphaera profundi]WDE96632.1 alpha/beta hydrolase [Lentisphaera profundi]